MAEKTPQYCAKLTQLIKWICEIRCKLFCCICITHSRHQRELARERSEGMLIERTRRSSLGSLGTIENVSVAEIIELEVKHEV
jgi:hypothetical protein